MAKENSKSTIGAGMSEETAKKLNKIAAENPGNDEGKENTNRNHFSKPHYRKPDTIEEALKHYPTHIVKLVNLVKSNSDIRRYTSLGIINYLFQKNIIEEAKGYVTFNWTKFSVTNRGLRVEYRYTEGFFLNCLIASFTSFANAAQKIIGIFCSKEFENTFSEDKTIIDNAVKVAENADEASEASESEE